MIYSNEDDTHSDEEDIHSKDDIRRRHKVTKMTYTVLPRFSALGRLLIQTVFEEALIRGGRLFKNVDK